MFRILKDIHDNGLEPKPVGGNDDQAHAISEEVQTSLEPYRKAKANAQDRAALALSQKEKSAANVLKAKADALKAHEKLDEHNAMVKARKAEKVKARVDQLASGAKVEPHILNFDIDKAAREIQKRAEDAAEEADAVLAQLLGIHVEYGNALVKAEADVSTAEEAINQAYLNGIATRMLEQHAVIRRLHAELSARVPSEIHRKPNTRPSALVEQALALVEGPGDFSVPVNELRVFDAEAGKWTPHSGPAVTTGFRDEHPLYVGGDHKPRNADGIPTKI